MTPLYTQNDIRSAYEPIEKQMRAKAVILGHARNTRDIREVALEGLDLSGVERVLDLGCGYGFFTEKLRGRLHEGARVLGIDLVDGHNGRVFLKAVQDMGYRGEFLCAPADVIAEMGDSGFDAVVASYSLYFFPHLVGEIARVLSSGGAFIAVTHSRHSLREVTDLVPRSMEKAGISPPPEIAINRLFRAFCLENGRELLEPFFGQVERIVYRNELLFPLDRIGECMDYLDTKRYLIFKDAVESDTGKVGDAVSYFREMLMERAKTAGRVVLTKDDAVFRCSRPREGGRKSA